MAVNRHVSKGLTRQPAHAPGTPFQENGQVTHSTRSKGKRGKAKGTGVPGFENTGGGTVPQSNTPRI